MTNELLARIGEIERKLLNLIRPGVIHSVNYSATPVPVVRVTIGANLTDWLPWITQRAGGDVTWWAPEIGEQVVVLAPHGELASAFVVPAIYQTAVPGPLAVATVHQTTYADGTVIKYDRAAHKLTANVQGDAEVLTTGIAKITATGAVTIKGSSITLDGPVEATSTIHAEENISTPADVLAAAISLKTHVHGGVLPGGSNTTGPV